MAQNYHMYQQNLEFLIVKMNKNKSIKSKRLKKYWPGKSAGAITSDNDDIQKMAQQQQMINKINGVVGNGLQFGASLYNDFQSPSFTTTPNTYQTNGPISYQRTDNVNSSQELSNLSKQSTANTLNTATTGAELGSAIGSFVGPVGTLCLCKRADSLQVNIQFVFMPA